MTKNPTSQESIKTLQWLVSRPDSDFCSVDHGPASSDELSTWPFWRTTEPSPDQLSDSCCSVKIGWPNNMNTGFFLSFSLTSLTSILFTKLGFEKLFPIVSKQAKFSFSSVSLVVSVIVVGNLFKGSWLKIPGGEDWILLNSGLCFDPNWGLVCLAPWMLTGVVLLGTSDEIKGKSGGWGMRIFFLGGEKGERWTGGMFDTISTNHGFTRFTFCSKSGSSHDTLNQINES